MELNVYWRDDEIPPKPSDNPEEFDNFIDFWKNEINKTQGDLYQNGKLKYIEGLLILEHSYATSIENGDISSGCAELLVMIEEIKDKSIEDMFAIASLREEMRKNGY